MGRKSRKGFTLVEVFITVVIAAIVVLAIITGIVAILHGQKLARERSLAQREAAMLIEEARRTAFPFLEPIAPRMVLIDDNRDPANERNNLTGLAELRLFRASDGTELTSASGEDLIIVQATVTWESVGRDRFITIVSHFAP